MQRLVLLKALLCAVSVGSTPPEEGMQTLSPWLTAGKAEATEVKVLAPGHTASGYRDGGQTQGSCQEWVPFLSTLLWSACGTARNYWADVVGRTREATGTQDASK